MNQNDFQSKSAGTVRTPQGFWAFMPNNLPPSLELNWSLAKLLSDADRALSELSGVGRQLPNPHLLISPNMHREAITSSWIEGTQAGMGDLFFHEADPEEPAAVPDVQEVANYIDAMNYGLDRLNELPISKRLVREIHARLMKDVRGGYATPGEFRTSPNWIGPPGCTLDTATFVPPTPTEMMAALTDWERYLHSDAQEPPLVQCALMHYQFEAIHPFLDGNGRVGRLLITFYLCERKHLSQPLLYLSSFFEEHRDEYYRRLLAVSQQGDWIGWITFFLRGVTAQSRAALASATAILKLHTRYRQMLGAKRVPQAATRLVDQIFVNPVVSVSALMKPWNMTFPTVQKGVDMLVTLGILREVTGRQRNKRYVAEELFELIAGPLATQRDRDLISGRI